MKKNHIALTLHVTYFAIAAVIAVSIGLFWIPDVNSLVYTLLPGGWT